MTTQGLNYKHISQFDGIYKKGLLKDFYKYNLCTYKII